MALNTFIRSLVLCVVASFVTSSEAVTVAFNSFEGDAGELNFTSSVNLPANGQIITQNSPPVQDGLTSLTADKSLGAVTQTDFMIDFDPVSLTGLTDVALSFYWHANITNNPYESADSLLFTITHDGTGSPMTTLIDFNALNAARNGTSTDEWQNLFEVIPDDATTLSFSVLANFNTSAENMFFDNLTITGTPPPVPEPSTFLLLGLGVLGLVRHTRRRRRKA